MDALLDLNVKYALDHGLLLVPVAARGKHLMSWRTIECFEQWRAAQAQYGDAINAAVHLNASNLCVIDLDCAEGFEALSKVMTLPATMTVRTARGVHLYYRRPNDLDVGNSGGIELDGDTYLGEYICGNYAHHYTLLPGSVHPSGRRYEWLSLPAAGIATLPTDIHRWVCHDTEPYGPMDL